MPPLRLEALEVSRGSLAQMLPCPVEDTEPWWAGYRHALTGFLGHGQGTQPQDEERCQETRGLRSHVHTQLHPKAACRMHSSHCQGAL